MGSFVMEKLMEYTLIQEVLEIYMPKNWNNLNK